MRSRNDGGELTAPPAQYPSASPNAPRHPRCCTSDARACPTAAASPTHTPGRRSVAGRIGRGAKPPPQFGQTLLQLGLDAVRAERALIAADPRFRRVRRQVLVAIFAVRPKLQRHGVPFGCSADIADRAPIANAGFPRFRPYIRPSSLAPILRGECELTCRRDIDSQASICASLDSPRMRHRANTFSGNRALSFNRSSTIEERTCATLWCGISTLLTISDRLFRSRSTALSR